MIFRMTVEDNDFTSTLESFAREQRRISFFDCFLSKRKVEDLTKDEMFDLITRDQDFTKLLNPHGASEKSEQEKSLLIEGFRIKYHHFINEMSGLPVGCKETLINDFKIDIVESFKESRENGEVLYLLSYSNTVIVQ